MDIEEEVKNLQDAFALIDMTYRPSSDSRYMEFLVKKLLNIKIKMYQEKGHSMPHVHIDYGHNKHVASYAIDDGKRLAGKLDSKYDVEVRDWIQKNRCNLISLWNDTQKGKAYKIVMLETG